MAIGSKDVSAIYALLYDPSYRPRRSPKAHIEQLTVDGKPAFILMEEFAGEYFEVEPVTNTIWQLLDGKKTVQEIYEQARVADDTLTEKEVKDTIVSLAEEGIIESTEPEVRRRRVEVISAFQINVHLLKDSSESLARFFRLTRKLFRREELPIAIGIAALGFILFYSTFIDIFAHPSVFNIAGSAVLGFFFYQMFVLLPVYAVHELAHAAVCDYYGARPREIGTGLYYLAPFFYCDTSDGWRLSRRARIMISAAGPLATVVISALLVIWSYLSAPGALQNALRISAFFGYYGTLVNFSPVIETDGYYILADALKIPNLRDEAFSFIKRFFLVAFRRPVSAVRQSARRRRIILLYSIVTVAWGAFFAYTTGWMMYIYGNSSAAAVSNLALTITRVRALDLTAVGVNIATLSYFGLVLAGFVVMGVVAFKKIRMKGVKLETIHDKRVSVFLPLASTMPRERSMDLVEKAEKVASGFARSYSVTLEPPLCVAAMRLGKVDQSLESMKGEMQTIEQSFRRLHSRFVSERAAAERGSARKALAQNLLLFAGQFPPRERKDAVSSGMQFLARQDALLRLVLQSAFGTVWTLELSPDDYERIRRNVFPGLIAEDLGATDLPGELEDFKKHTVLGSDGIAQLSAEIEKESREVYRRPEYYQITAFLEPLKSRLVFLGRTDRVEGSVVWLGGLYLYQAWTSYVGEMLQDAALGLQSIRLGRSMSLTKAQVGALRDDELETLGEDLKAMAAMTKTVESSLGKLESTYESAKNFHEMLDSLVSDEAFDVGLYTPILSSNARHLEGVRDRLEDFRSEFGRVSKKLEDHAAEIEEERSRRAAEGDSGKKERRGIADGVASRLLGNASRGNTPGFGSEVRLIFAVTRLTYGVVAGSDYIF